MRDKKNQPLPFKSKHNSYNNIANDLPFIEQPKTNVITYKAEKQIKIYLAYQIKSKACY